MFAKADYWSEQDIILWRLVFTITLVLAIFTALFFYFNFRGAVPVAEVPDYKIEPQTTLTAKPTGTR